MKIQTKFIHLPVATRSFDWSAIDYDTYDGKGCPIGYGETELEAISDLVAQLEDA